MNSNLTTHTKREARISFPRDLEQENVEVLCELGSKLASTFGGFTQTKASLIWADDDGEGVEMPVRTFDVVADDSAETKLFEIAEWLREGAELETVSLQLPNGKVVFV